MNSHDDVEYRLRLCEEFLGEAQADHLAERWAACVEHAQLAVENAAKSVLACRGPVPQTHDSQPHLRAVLVMFPNLPPPVASALETLISACGRLGFREHVLASYGDERARKTPSEIFGREEADQTLLVARSALDSARTATKYFTEDRSRR